MPAPAARFTASSLPGWRSKRSPPGAGISRRARSSRASSQAQPRIPAIAASRDHRGLGRIPPDRYRPEFAKAGALARLLAAGSRIPRYPTTRGSKLYARRAADRQSQDHSDLFSSSPGASLMSPPGFSTVSLISAPSQRLAAVQAVGHSLGMEIRTAITADAVEACSVLRRSISELCFLDHRNDQNLLSRWLSNKTPENVVRWIGRPDHSLLVAVEDDAILAVGAVTDDGEITLNYVSPDARFRGVSKALMCALEISCGSR